MGPRATVPVPCSTWVREVGVLAGDSCLNCSSEEDPGAQSVRGPHSNLSSFRAGRVTRGTPDSPALQCPPRLGRLAALPVAVVDRRGACKEREAPNGDARAGVYRPCSPVRIPGASPLQRLQRPTLIKIWRWGQAWSFQFSP